MAGRTAQREISHNLRHSILSSCLILLHETRGRLSFRLGQCDKTQGMVAIREEHCIRHCRLATARHIAPTAIRDGDNYF